ncbi:putative non-specific serine/threonine protein kinase [Rosa chinensis]|uniref:Putative non-specific serine/threonine protein kinase n=1 Tax=Rosa chinensis TaxID=74649 RepID=A0A2P6PHP0_ROSCH|nr:putative non-specific serine/threonine protein kinase [Rosa chinensis]
MHTLYTRIGKAYVLDLPILPYKVRCTNFNLFLSFPNLEYLNLTLNKLFVVIPPQISSLSKFIYLDLSENQFTVRISPKTGLLTNLRRDWELEMSSASRIGEDNLIGSIQTTFGDITNLTILLLFRNNLSGTINSREIGNSKSLVKLDLGENQLNGSIPTSFGNLSNLEFLILYDNQLSGSIPQKIGKLMKLIKLGLEFGTLILLFNLVASRGR